MDRRSQIGVKRRDTLNNKLQNAYLEAGAESDDSDDESSEGGVDLQVQKLKSVKDGYGAQALGGAIVAHGAPAPAPRETQAEDVPRPSMAPGAASGKPGRSSMARMSVMMDFGKKAGAEKLAKMDATQRAMGVMFVVMVAWCIVSTAILGAFADRYLRVDTTLAREWYVINGCVSWAKVRAARILGAALRAADAVDVAVKFGIWSSPTDYNAVEQVLAPIFTESAELYEVELALSDRPFTMVIRRNVHNPTELTIQSDSADCYLLGVDGCADLGASSRVRPPWYANTLYGPTNSSWASGPEIATRQRFEKATNKLHDIITPTYSYYFRTVFPGFSNPPVVLLGHVTLEIGSLSGSAIQDERLGEDGRVFIADGDGWLLSAQNPRDLLVLRDQGHASEIGFRRIWGLSEPWADPLRSGFGGGAALEMQQLHGDTGAFVAVSPLDEPLLSRFAVAAIAPYRMPFTDEGLLWASVISVLIALIPYILFASAFVYLTGKHVGAQMKNRRTTVLFSGSVRNFKNLASRVSAKTVRSPSAWFKKVRMTVSRPRWTKRNSD